MSTAVAEIAEARGKTMHPEIGLPALADNPDAFDYDHWKAISTGGPANADLAYSRSLGAEACGRLHTWTTV